MSLVFTATYTVIGLILLISGGDRLVVGAAALAKKFKMSDLFIGIAIVGFGTSLPEMMAILSAVRAGTPDIALGNIIGSNIANIGLIMGFGLLFTAGITQLAKNQRDYALMLLGFLLLNSAFVLLGVLTWQMGLGFIALLAGYLWLSSRQGHIPHVAPDEELARPLPIWLASGYVLFGLIALAGGAELLITGATDIARHVGVTERIIGLTLVALGTSLPELAAAVAAARRGKLSMIAGNVLGSNLFNILAGVGLSSMLLPLPMGDFAGDLSIMLLFGLLLMPLFLSTGIRARGYGVVLLLGYLFYIGSIL